MRSRAINLTDANKINIIFKIFSPTIRIKCIQCFSKWAIAYSCGSFQGGGGIRPEDISGARLCRKQNEKPAMQCGLF